MINPRLKGFVLMELLITTFVVIIIMIISVDITVSIDKNSRVLALYLSSYLKGREAIDVISKDCRMAIGVMDYYSGYVTTDNCLVLKVPSIDSSGNIIDVNNQFDYIIYRVNNGDLWKIVIPGASSSRPARNEIFKKNIESFYISCGGAGLSGIPHKSTIPYLTLWAAISEEMLGRDYSINTGTTVKLMNYEWEYIR